MVRYRIPPLPLSVFLLKDCEKILQETLSGEASTTGSETTQYATTTTTETTTNTGSDLEGVSDIESAFDELLA